MIDVRNIEGVSFVGIGGIGMSALARWFIAGGFDVSGYDRSESNLTKALVTEGCHITFTDDIYTLPAIYSELTVRDKILVIYTPAIPAENKILSWFRDNGYPLYKRSEILGEISENTDTLAVAGTHGKTTVSTMLAHILKQSSIDCSAFLGGISKNYDSNLLLGDSPLTVMEADEFDRSFHRLNPAMAVVTSVDADHLDIYGDHQTMIEAYNIFCRRIRKGGCLVINYGIKDKISAHDSVKKFTYGYDEGADFRAFNIRLQGECFLFDLKTPEKTIENIRFPFPGRINIENAVAASSLALMNGVTEFELRKALLIFQGVQRRFDIRINRPGLIYIDDYAHHPEEIRACITSVREFFGGRKVTGIFQPHLFSRTKDHAAGFAKILDTLDEVIILPIYPAREKPMTGITSSLIFEKMVNRNKRLLEKNDIPGALDIDNIDVLLTIGAGDIDRLVAPIEDELNRRRR